MSITSLVPSDILPGHLHHPQLRLVATAAAPRRDQHLAHAVAVQVEELWRRRVVVAFVRVSSVGRIVDVGSSIEAPGKEPRSVPRGFAGAYVARHHERGVEAHDTLAQSAVVHREARQEQREDVALGEHRGDAFSSRASFVGVVPLGGRTTRPDGPPDGVALDRFAPRSADRFAPTRPGRPRASRLAGPRFGRGAASFFEREPKEEGPAVQSRRDRNSGNQQKLLTSLPAVPAGRNCYLGKTPLVAVWKKVRIARSFRFGGEK